MLNNIRIEFGFGIQRDRDLMGISRDDANQALRDIQIEAARLFGAFTIQQTYGGWTNGAGRVVEEDGRTLFVIVPSPVGLLDEEVLHTKVEALANLIKQSLNQEAVAISASPVNFILF